ncbi:MAG: hypothetical protein A2667_00740 [Candidatus Wildermuthbacteria bacterium RIFCSPHIGHO2_01_FULL_47_27]|uniref:Uncharacterized protein n=1 Tax=Candidatus Wildermuthbacteria bacterium RIFCSPHIGHO2_02_FULL_47_17 TaxID=1802452 RepID=A0A1G2R3E5_9BACT|nr:MAG: hypothetical protein A2667_00740 [Candidatus Wildermuthbacteria bacterium RIFCSPHIGHO2_01_FULL_47_27]OHA67385.1 MAG: hypothetical protein A3D59_01310 [Candidatus Wildermuthbacteria bacterium RIFCSPHIGHO2_02_FULL_47_17]OHA76136.1 MAG: hypothetical protein A3I38_02785 [Candidatus Wildermuthbacteria bacterium RIFCSPLOWO2_02_FULL_47_10]
MEILIFILSVLAITVLVWLANKILPFKICPICVGVSGTWVWILAGISSGLLNVENWRMIVAMAMGAAVVGIAYQGEKRFDWAKQSIFRFRVPVIVVGFPLAYWVINNIDWVSLAAALAVLAPVFYFYFVVSAGQRSGSGTTAGGGKVAELVEKLKNCCD